uniref:Uncharacterized protein n=1 Tax=Ditylenchus dipsaci TaxID=166011 RepID=A0A915D284_9BILA
MLLFHQHPEMPCCCCNPTAQPSTSAALQSQPVRFNYLKSGVEALSSSQLYGFGGRTRLRNGFYLILLTAILASTTFSTVDCISERTGRSNVLHLNDVCDNGVGKCAQGLQCVLRHNENLKRCTETDKERCLKAKCKVMFPSCPFDSRPIVRLPAPGECCAKPAICQCDPQKCDRYVPNCSCCDRFECRQPELHCENAKCPDSSETYDLYSKDGKSCPPDSFRPALTCPRLLLSDYSECRCQAAICPPVRCSSTQAVVIEKKGSGRPGNFTSNKTDSEESQVTVVSLPTYCIH